MKLFFCLITILLLINSPKGLSALLVKRLSFHTVQTNYTITPLAKNTTVEMNLTSAGKQHLTFSEKLKSLRQLHKFRNQRFGDTHYGALSVCFSLAPYLLFEISVVSGAFLIAGTLSILLILGSLLFLAVVIFGIKGLRTDKHNGHAIIGLIFGILGLSGYILGLIILSLLHAL